MPDPFGRPPAPHHARLPERPMLANRSIPNATIIPVLPYQDVHEAAAWLCDAFGFRERLRIAGHRIQLTFSDGAVVAVQREGGNVDGTGGSVMVRVEDVDAHCARAERCGARVVRRPTDYPYGERQYTAVDLGGHSWTFSQSIADVHPESWGGTLVEPGAAGAS